MFSLFIYLLFLKGRFFYLNSKINEMIFGQLQVEYRHLYRIKMWMYKLASQKNDTKFEKSHSSGSSVFSIIRK